VECTPPPPLVVVSEPQLATKVSRPFVQQLRVRDVLLVGVRRERTAEKTSAATTTGLTSPYPRGRRCPAAVSSGIAARTQQTRDVGSAPRAAVAAVAAISAGLWTREICFNTIVVPARFAWEQLLDLAIPLRPIHPLPPSVGFFD